MTIRMNASVIALAFAAAAFAQPALALQNTGDTAGTQASIIVMNQKLKDSKVKLTYAYAPEKSFAVVFRSDEGGKTAGKPLGTVELNAGDHRNVDIPLSGVKPGDKLWVSLYQVQNGDTQFNRAHDVSYWAGKNLPKANSFIIQ
ncbi:DUF7282 domain-containing protein [Hyphomicrobium methylovorum]|uniref:DUF7282 domain-containing protein n=1 Tax=Hyphomicrobium methylovorum TaxID=84 RepID=UPI0015E6ED80|nr:hypothetical protein [Hyphomicrobium methylovorum]